MEKLLERRRLKKEPVLETVKEVKLKINIREGIRVSEK
jgi:hypothetical protein